MQAYGQFVSERETKVDLGEKAKAVCTHLSRIAGDLKLITQGEDERSPVLRIRHNSF